MRSGYLVIEGCFHCRNRISFFSEEPVPPIDDYQEGEHFWSYLSSYQASKFDLKCKKCAKDVRLPDVMAIMLCQSCNPECGVFQLGAQPQNQKAWIYVALCANSSHASGHCISTEGIHALNEYFNYGLRDPLKKIIVAPCRLRKSVDTCHGIILADVGLTELY
ncbi:MAG: hypothetical protein WCC06_13255 [Candidatus Aminicenantales bacterium]